jgi:hypothetical protein
MNVSYAIPIQRAWARMQRVLFTPFALRTWCVMGFAAFLSEWMSGGWGRTGGQFSRGDHELPPRLIFERVHDFLFDPRWMTLIVTGLVVVMVIVLVFQMIGARGKFVFLDNVARERAAIVDPWRRYGAAGWSLFFWRLAFWIVTLALVGATLLPVMGLAIAAIREERLSLLFVGPMLLSVCLLMLVLLIARFVLLLLDDFVVPLMYRHGIGVTEGWRRFGALFGRHWPSFVMYGLMVLVMAVAVGFALVMIGFATCCVGFLLMASPYLGQIVLLPMYVFFRALGPEFLAQFGPEFETLAAAPVAAPPAAPAPGAGA